MTYQDRMALVAMLAVGIVVGIVVRGVHAIDRPRPDAFESAYLEAKLEEIDARLGHLEANVGAPLLHPGATGERLSLGGSVAELREMFLGLVHKRGDGEWVQGGALAAAGDIGGIAIPTVDAYGHSSVWLIPATGTAAPGVEIRRGGR